MAGACFNKATVQSRTPHWERTTGFLLHSGGKEGDRTQTMLSYFVRCPLSLSSSPHALSVKQTGHTCALTHPPLMQALPSPGSSVSCDLQLLWPPTTITDVHVSGVPVFTDAVCGRTHTCWMHLEADVRNRPPLIFHLITEAQSLRQTQNSSSWLVCLASLLWNALSLPSSAGITGELPCLPGI